MSEELKALLRAELGGAEAIITDSGDFLGISDLDTLVEEDRPDLKFSPFAPRFPERIREYGGDCFAALRAKDIVVHHRSEEHTSELQSLIPTTYAVFCMTTKKPNQCRQQIL